MITRQYRRFLPTERLEECGRRNGGTEVIGEKFSCWPFSNFLVKSERIAEIRFGIGDTFPYTRTMFRPFVFSQKVVRAAIAWCIFLPLI